VSQSQRNLCCRALDYNMKFENSLQNRKSIHLTKMKQYIILDKNKKTSNEQGFYDCGFRLIINK
jgi:hypothetical protein